MIILFIFMILTSNLLLVFFILAIIPLLKSSSIIVFFIADNSILHSFTTLNIICNYLRLLLGLLLRPFTEVIITLRMLKASLSHIFLICSAAIIRRLWLISDSWGPFTDSCFISCR